MSKLILLVPGTNIGHIRFDYADSLPAYIAQIIRDN